MRGWEGLFRLLGCGGCESGFFGGAFERNVPKILRRAGHSVPAASGNCCLHSHPLRAELICVRYSFPTLMGGKFSEPTPHAARCGRIRACLWSMLRSERGTERCSSPRCFCPSNMPSTSCSARLKRARRGARRPWRCAKHLRPR